MEKQKTNAAQAALEFVEDGTKLGLGTGSTAEIFVELLAKRVSEGLNIICVPTSESIKIKAELLSIPVTTLKEETHLDLTIDGADEIDDTLNLIKGGGGALLREKIVAMASENLIIIAHENKLVKNLGSFPLPIEVAKFGVRSTQEMISRLAEEVNCKGDIKLRTTESGSAFITDEGHYILDCAFHHIPSPDDLEDALSIIPGVIETGLFLGLADCALIGTDDGVDLIEAPKMTSLNDDDPTLYQS